MLKSVPLFPVAVSAAGWIAHTCKQAPCRVCACVLTAEGASVQRVGAWFRQLETTGATPDVVATLRRAVLSSLADTVEAG